MARPWGVDVSHYQTRVDWQKVAKAGASFAFAKATEGVRSSDDEFKRNWPAIFKAGIKVRGAYHYAHIESDPVEQAAHFVSTVVNAGGFHKGDFAVLDAEDVYDLTKWIGPAATATWVMRWLDEVVRLTGLPRKRVLVYTGAWWWGPRAGGSDAPAKAGHPLWLAAYTQEDRLNFKPWRTWRFWQYSSSGRVPGVSGHCDVNWFNGSYRGLLWLSGRKRAALHWKAT